MSDVNKFNQLLIEGKTKDAIKFCNDMIETMPQFSFYQFWLNRLQNVDKLNINVININIEKDLIDNRNNFSINFEEIGRLVKDEFKNHTYQIEPNRAIGNKNDQSKERQKLEKSFPFKGDIYLPTSNVSLANQVEGLRIVSDLVSSENKVVSKSRFEALKKIILSRGKKRVFILGNGPSLKKTDLNLLKDEITIGFNGIFLHDTFTPTIHVVEDHLVAEDRVQEITDYKCPVKIFPSYLGYCIPIQENTIFLNHLSRISFPVDTDFSDDVGEISYTGGTVTYTGLQIAVSLGFEEIYLIGVDASYQVENVERSTEYGTGVLCSKSDDINHFDPSYFGKGYRWHDPNVHTMLQAYRKARNYANIHNIKVINATIGGELDVFPRVDYYGLFEHKKVYPKTAIIDFTHIDWLCATGIVKKNMFDGWAKHSLFHMHGQNPDLVITYQKIKNDCYAAGADKTGIWAALRTIMEYNPDILYLRPTHDRPALSVFQLIMPLVLNKPFVIHYMDDWLAKIEMLHGKDFSQVYYKTMGLMFSKANKVLTISQKMAEYLTKEFNVEEKRLQVVHNYIQEQVPLSIPKDNTAKVIRYFGGMEPDMSLASIKAISKAVEIISTEDNPVRFEIYTGQNYIDRFSPEFSEFTHTTISKQHDNYQVYLALLGNSNLNVLCYNFDERSEVYLKYSMANKLPETIGANVPFLAMGSKEIGTISYLLEQKYPFVIDKENDGLVETTIRSILFSKKSANEAYFDSLTRLKEEFSASRNQHGFQNMLRVEASQSVASYSKDEIDMIKSLVLELIESLGARAKKFESLKVLLHLLELSEVQKVKLNEMMQSHGVSWQFKDRQKNVKQILRKEKRNSQDEVEMYSFWITSLEHERFTETNSKIAKLIG